MDSYALSVFEIRALLALLEAEDAGENLTDHNGPHVALETLVNRGGVDEIRLFEAQRTLGIYTAQSVRALKLNVSGEGSLPWKTAMELTLVKARELQVAGLLNEEGPLPSDAETNRAVFAARDEAQHARYKQAVGGLSE